MILRPRALAALPLVALSLVVQATPAGAQATVPPATETAAPPPPETCDAPPAKRATGFAAFLSAANRAGAADLLSGRSGAMFGSGKRGGIAGAVLGSALSAADGEGVSGGPPPSMPIMSGEGRTAQIAAVATGAVVGLARRQATAAATPTACASN